MPPRAAFRTNPRAVQQEGFFGRLLDPIDRLSETIFSVLILLTFTLSYRIVWFSTEPYAPIPADYLADLVIAALGATVAWGLIDGVVYALLSVFDRGAKHRFLARIQAASSEEESISVIGEELDYVLEPITRVEQRRLLYVDMLDYLRESRPQPVSLTRADFYGGLGVVLIAVLAVLPSLVPLVLLRDHYWLALGVSNLISIGVLFITGYQWGTYNGSSPIRAGLLLAGIGFVLAAIAIPLGG